MDKKHLMKRMGTLIIFIFIVNFLATKLYWYSLVWWFDMPMHFLGGFWVALATLWLVPSSQFNFKFVFKIIACVLLVGVAWEIYEFIFYNYVASNAFNRLDTISDICFDLAGGFLSILYFFKKSSPRD